MKLWFTSDTHFGHERTLELSKRPFGSVAEMDKQIINNWNSVISTEDIVYHLGDVGELHRLSELNANHIKLVLGNYEHEINILDSHNQLDNRVEIIQSNSLIEIDGITFRLVHKPEDALPGYFCLFGHIHKLQMVKRNGLGVGVDAHHFMPIDSETIRFYHNAIVNHYDENVFMDILG